MLLELDFELELLELELLELELLELAVEVDVALVLEDEEADEVAELAVEVEVARVLAALPGPVIEPVGLTNPVRPRPSKEWVRRRTASPVLPSIVLNVPFSLTPVTNPTWERPSCFQTATSPTRRLPGF